MLKLGGFRIYPLSDGAFHLDGGQIFGIVPRRLWSQRFQPDAENRVPLYLRPLLLDTGERRVIIDAGIGDHYGDKFAQIYSIQRERGQLLESLRGIGYRPEDITDVIFTHLHFDHCGGATTLDEQGTPRLTFPRAHHHVSAAEYEAARNPNLRTRGSYRADFIEPIAASGRMRSIQDGENFLPGFTAIHTPGHTKDHLSILVQSEGEHLMFWGDLMPLAAHANPAWGAALDTHPLDTLECKLALLQRAEDEGWHYHYFYHELQPIFTPEKLAETLGKK